MKQQHTISAEIWQQLLDDQDRHCVSLILPMEEYGPETRKNSIALKTALKNARPLLEQQGLAAEKINALLQPAEDLIGNEDFWQHQARTLALYLSEKSFRPFILKQEFPEYVSVGERYYLLPLLQTMSGRNLAFLLTLSQKHVKLYRWTSGHLAEESVPDLPADMDEALLLDPEKATQVHVVGRKSTGDGPIMGVHGHGAGKDTESAHLRAFLHVVEGAVTRHLRATGHNAPLVLASVEENFVIYREINEYEQLADSRVEGNFDHASADELAGQLAGALAEQDEIEHRTVLQSLRERVGQGQGSVDLAEAIRAAREGRVDICAIAEAPPHRTGQWDEATFESKLDPEVNPQHPDLLDFAAVSAWERGGKVIFALRDELPEGADLAVTYRYSVEPQDNPGNPPGKNA